MMQSSKILGSLKVNSPVLTSATADGLLSNPKCRLPLPAAIYGDYLIQPQVKLKRQPKYFQVYAKLQENGDSGSDGHSTSHDLLNAITKNSEICSSPEKRSAISDDSSCHLDQESHISSLNDELTPDSINYQVCLDKLKAIYLHVLASEQWNASRLNICHRTYLWSAANLIHYLAVHTLEVQQLKEELSSIGLLDFDNTTSHVLASITACIQLLENLSHISAEDRKNIIHMKIRDQVTAQSTDYARDATISTMRKTKFMHARALFGSIQDKKDAHIMVTVGQEVISNKILLDDLLKAGADIIRINCAHDDPSIWSEIIRLVKHSSQMQEKPCRVLMDLAGPKLRTGPLKSGPRVIKISPKKDAKGDVIFPSQVYLSPAGCCPPAHISPDAVLFLEGDRLFQEIEVGVVLGFVDARGRKRSLKVSEKLSVFSGHGYIAECSRTAYVGCNTTLFIEGKKKKKAINGKIVNVPPAEQFVRLQVGDLLTILRDSSLSGDELGGTSIGSPKITCPSGRLFDSVKPGDPIAFDDGKIWGVIQGAGINEIVVSITHASPKGSKLGSEKSINIPKSEMKFEGLTSKDLVDLEFVAANADMVGISFIRDVHDVTVVMQELKKRKLQNLGVVLKIETRGAFENLPLLLLEAMQYPNPLGVMIARGDLAVECEWQQLASIQDEILSICSAAHVPVIWATQVLESLTKSGIPTRAEITDATNGMRANCIMLNKGKHIVEAVSALDSMSKTRSTGKLKTLPRPPLFSNF
ncbi:plastidial pyruvate kinase 4, chloroplastic isoform X1 [Dioscorea cayenensis subsp. rotundata]|uniref:pyruvate kinase n=1 Tax=Dioscorea cayennensis subsp. rotundata TaxID=55577 RepID=A0AB40BD06_DIOCR|nr:plastidial pyruvate kinase 4, chloroplastic isoform X1 [Dioscorea cayenensis subsp. rotundata]XP_039124517.1 plastidial pyruvate kinase 4, chloroplastic isoform X1 [Dioscorea cayenensis subsp. rotundata]XP_039124518.1 plastidial pyruvate kinase 4, chloroplastic isoform X1 [Dioscorea cayenensis subsp. rotundata]